jgi:hypothetical protein
MIVTPAQAGVSPSQFHAPFEIPACAGMTIGGGSYGLATLAVSR